MTTLHNSEQLLSPLAAAYHLGITSELLFQYTKRSFARASGLRSLATANESGKTQFSVSELDEFDALLAGPWPAVGASRPTIPKAVLDHLRAESINQCARCGSGIGVDTAHIRPWAESQSHHHANLIRLCSACHREHDAQHSLPTAELLKLKKSLIERTRVNLKARMQPVYFSGNVPRPATSFLGRDRELSELTDALQSGRSILVTGVGGIGKTELLVQALHRVETGRPTFWFDVDRYRSASDILAAVRAAIGENGIACPEAMVASRLDALQACVVLDGIEQASLKDMDDFEDVLAGLYSATSKAQFLATSQVVLHRFTADVRFKIGRLDDKSSTTILKRLSSSWDSGSMEDVGPLIVFCEGHALTLRLATALMDYYGGASATLRAINTKGATAVKLPGRNRQSRATSLELCLQTAYEALSAEGRQLLWTLAESPAGLLTHCFETNWCELSDPMEAIAELRRWHLVDVVHINENPSRTYVLAPIRAFAIRRARQDDRDRYEAIRDWLIRANGVMVAVWELKYDTPEDTPYVLRRMSDELPNLLHVLDVARTNRATDEAALTAVGIAKSLMRYFFVLNLPEQGVRVLHEAAELAFSSNHFEAASSVVLQLMALAQRANNEALTSTGLHLLDKIETHAHDDKLLANIAMCRGIMAHNSCDYAGAEAHARKAFAWYRSQLRALLDKQTQDQQADDAESPDLQDVHNDISSALGLLGFALLSSGRYEDAVQAYQHSLRHQRGAYAAVNRGQTLHQIANCESHLGRFRDAALHYLQAANVFSFVGMEGYLSNALGELGYALLDLGEEELAKNVDMDLITQGLSDLYRDTRHVFNPTQSLDHSRCIGALRKLFGSIALVSVIGKGQLLRQFCISLNQDVVGVLGAQLSSKQRNPEEAFPLVMVDTALRLGFLVSEAEQSLDKNGDVSRDAIEEMIQIVFDTHDWAQDTMRVIDWLAMLLTRRWTFQGVSSTRLREFITNRKNGGVEHLDLTRK